MKCSIQGCPGHYQHKFIVHTVKQGDEVVVFDHVPAEVCDICSDTLLSPETIRHLEAILEHQTRPSKQAPVYEYV